MTAEDRLLRALEKAKHVRVGDSTGFVLEVTDAWTALLSTRDGVPGALVLLRTGDVRRVRRSRRHEALAQRLLEAAGAWPPVLPEVLDLDDARTVLFTAASLAPVLGIGAGDDLVTANVYRLGRRRAHVWEVTSDGRWRDELTSVALSDVTRVELGGPRLTALRALVGPPPRSLAER